MEGALQLGRIAGIPIAVHSTWFVALALITLSLAHGFFPETYPGWNPATYWATGLVAALALFVSVLLHELSHAAVARRRGLRVDSITLFIFGGVARIRSEAETPRDEFLIAIVGPGASVLIGAAFWLAQLLVGGISAPVRAILDYLALVNVILALFNLLPGYPLDGGRVLRAIIWGATGSLARATVLSSYAGQGLAFVFIGLGVVQFFAGQLLSGLWIAFMGWFLHHAAEASRQQMVTQQSFSGVRVRDLMLPDPPTAGPDLPLQRFIGEYVIQRGLRALPVVDDGRVVGIVSISDVKGVPAGQWESMSIGEVMTRASLAAVRPNDDLTRALRLLAERDLNQLLVMEEERLLGLLSRSSIIRYLQLLHELGAGSLLGRRR